MDGRWCCGGELWLMYGILSSCMDVGLLPPFKLCLRDTRWRSSTDMPVQLYLVVEFWGSCVLQAGGVLWMCVSGMAACEPAACLLLSVVLLLRGLWCSGHDATVPHKYPSLAFKIPLSLHAPCSLARTGPKAHTCSARKSYAQDSVCRHICDTPCSYHM